MYLLQIVDAGDPHQVVRFPAGGALEVALIEACVRNVVARGVGVFRTRAHVESDVRDGITDVIRALKWQTVGAK